MLYFEVSVFHIYFIWNFLIACVWFIMENLLLSAKQLPRTLGTFSLASSPHNRQWDAFLKLCNCLKIVRKMSQNDIIRCIYNIYIMIKFPMYINLFLHPNTTACNFYFNFYFLNYFSHIITSLNLLIYIDLYFYGSSLSKS